MEQILFKLESMYGTGASFNVLMQSCYKLQHTNGEVSLFLYNQVGRHLELY